MLSKNQLKATNNHSHMWDNQRIYSQTLKGNRY